MAATRELRHRIKSVRSTRQITKAMELISASKMRRASEATLASRPYASRIDEVINDLLKELPEGFAHPLLEKRPIKKTLVIAIASDRGMAGIYNAAVTKKALVLLKLQEESGRETTFITIGKKIEHSLLQLNQNVVQSYPNFTTHPTSKDTGPIATSIIRAYAAKEYDEVILIYTEFYSMLRQEALLRPLLPLQYQVPKTQKEPGEFLYEPNPAAVLDDLLQREIEVQLFQAVLESIASEHSARRLAMKNATDNATEMISDLTLTYNGLRQSAITQEIAEITGGAAALTA